jgi:hypothetical protein
MAGRASSFGARTLPSAELDGPTTRSEAELASVLNDLISAVRVRPGLVACHDEECHASVQ